MNTYLDINSNPLYLWATKALNIQNKQGVLYIYILYTPIKNTSTQIGRKGIEPSIAMAIEFTAQPVNQHTEPSFIYIYLYICICIK